LKTALTVFVFVIVSAGCGGSSVKEQASGGSAGANGTGGSAGSAGTAGAGASAGTGASAGNGGASGMSGASGSGGASGNDGGSGASGASGSSGSAGAGATGGASGANGTGGAAGTGGSPGGQCQDVGQCRLYSDCCFCLALGPNQPDPMSCAADCEQDRCAALGVTSASMRCAGGRCAAGFNCAGNVTCRLAPPVCEPGQVPSIVGNCWGSCVPAAQCASVRDCTVCMVPGQTCSTLQTLAGPQNVCVPIPERCRDNPTCACMGEAVCPSFTTCVDRSGIPGVVCSCPAC
jgi:hypothetical protein